MRKTAIRVLSVLLITFSLITGNNAKYQVNISNNAAFLARLTNSIYVEYIGFIRALATERQGATRTQEGRVIVACAICGRAGGMRHTTHARSSTRAQSSGRGAGAAEGVFSTLLDIIT